MSEIPPLPAKRSSCLFKIAILAVVSLLVLGGLWWWQNRPIRPVELSAAEKAAVEAKVEAIQKPAGPTYEKGSKEIILRERELNGLLNEKTTLGKSISFELAENAIHARIETDLEPSLPVIGGKRLKARARFLVGGVAGKPDFILDDLTVWGVSLPNDWLAGLKGKDLIGGLLGGEESVGIAGVEEFRVELGRLIIRLAE